MKIDVLTLFPKMFDALEESIVGKAIDAKKIEFQTIDFRKFTKNKHNNVDDYPYGGGEGMLLMPQPVIDAISSIDGSKPYVVLLDPAGERFNNKMASSFAKKDHIVLISGHYEGYDERIKTLADKEVSVGDYILTGGELAAMNVIDATIRFVPEVLGNKDSASKDSFENSLLKYPQYTRPEEFNNKFVPEVLLSGNHEMIDEWRQLNAYKKTLEKRPDLLNTHVFSKNELEIILNKS